MKNLICVLIIFGQLGIGQYNSITKRYDLREDGSGKRIGYIEKNKIVPDYYYIRNTKGKRIGAIHWNGIRNVWVIEKE